MAKFIATARGFDGLQVREPGEQFEYDGAPAQWCHEVGKSALPKVRIDPLMNRASDPNKVAENLAAVIAQNEKLTRELAELKEKKK